MPYPHPNLTTIKAQSLTDIRGANLGGTGSAPLPNSILGQIAYAISGQCFDLYGFLDWVAANATPFGATSEWLAQWAALKGIFRLPASSATGTVSFTGLAGTIVASGTVLTSTTGVQYTTTAGYTIGTSAPVGIQAVVAGAAGNAPAGIALSLSTPLAGVTAATNVSVLVAGADQELDTSLRARMLIAYANPPDGGSNAQFVAWSLQVPGCTRAWCVDEGAGAGTVLVYCMFDLAEVAFGGFPQGANGCATLETRGPTPATGDQLLVANYLFPLRPATALVEVYAPVPFAINFVFQSLAPASNSTVEAAIKAALQDCMLRLGDPLGTGIFPSDTNAAAESAAGVNRYVLVSPVGIVTPPVGALPVVGTVVYQ